MVTFTYLQGQEVHLTEFVRHLEVYLPLFRQLSEFRFLYLARLDSHFEKGQGTIRFARGDSARVGRIGGPAPLFPNSQGLGPGSLCIFVGD